MGMTGEDALGASRKYTDETILGGGAVKGKNCTVSSITEADGVHRITFSWTLDNGTVKTQSIEVKDGEEGYTPVKDVDYFDGEKGDKGDKGVGIELVRKTGSTGIVDNYEILFTDGSVSTFTIVNGANITKVSELENDEEFIKSNTIALTNYYLKDEAYSKSQIDELLRNVGAGLSVKIVSTLPITEISGTTIYLINTSGTNYNQYMYIDGEWANLGSTAVDMSSYYNKTQIDNKLDDYVTANRLTNKLDDYALKTSLSKVAKSNSYNDLDDLPTIPDVEGIKPYTNELQDSENAAPTSKALYDAVQDLSEAIEGATQIDDTTTTATDKTWSAKKINDSLVDKADKSYVDDNLGELESALKNYDKADMWEEPLINILNNSILSSGKEITFTINTPTISDLPIANRGIVITRKNSLNNRGVQEYHCNESTNNNIYYRYVEWNGTKWSVSIPWQELATMNKVPSSKNRISEQIVTMDNLDGTKTGLSIDFDANSGQIRLYVMKNGVSQKTVTFKSV